MNKDLLKANSQLLADAIWKMEDINNSCKHNPDIQHLLDQIIINMGILDRLFDAESMEDELIEHWKADLRSKGQLADNEIDFDVTTFEDLIGKEIKDE